jgi:hypothetical protein
VTETPPTVQLPPLLYHYTTGGGLQGILQSNEIWATDIRYLNDYTELVGSRDRLLEIMRAVAEKPRRRNSVLAAQFADRIQHEQWPNLRARPAGPFVSCFCAKGDLLSQWRGYGRGGYALGFHRASLDVPPAIVARNPEGNMDRTRLPSEVGLLRVEYAEDAQELMLQRVADEIISPDASAQGTGRGTRLASMAAAGIKRRAFEEEQEWRYVVSSFGHHDEKFRLSATGMFIPYVSIPLDLKMCLLSVTVGPSDGQDRARLEQRLVAVERLLEKHGLSDTVEVIPSDVPFREI